MDQTARRIIDIDRDTIRLKEKTNEVIADKDTNLEMLLEQLEVKYKKEGELEGEKIYKSIISEGKKVVEERERQENKSLMNLENLYNQEKGRVVEEIWKDLFI